MTCPSCGGQWCWLCEMEIHSDSALPEHYKVGRCKDKQFVTADSIEVCASFLTS